MKIALEISLYALAVPIFAAVLMVGWSLGPLIGLIYMAYFFGSVLKR